MNKIKPLILFLLCFVLLAGCTGPSEPATQSTAASTEATQPSAPAGPSAQEQYLSALHDLQAEDHLTMEITQTREVSLGDDTYVHSAEQTLTVENLNSEHPTVHSDELLRYGMDDPYWVEIEEYYNDGTVLIDIDGNLYQSAIAAEDYLLRFVPVALLDPSMYDSVRVTQAEDDEIEILFSGAEEAERWLSLEDITVLEAEGRACLEDGRLTECQYTVHYAYGGTTISDGFLVEYEEKADPIVSPKQRENYVSLEHPDLPRQLEAVTGMLFQAKTVSTLTSESYLSYAAGAYIGRFTQIDSCYTDDKLNARSDYSVSIVDYTHNAETTQYQQLETYMGGKYSISIDGGAPEYSKSVTQEDMEEYILSSLIANILMSEYLASATMTDLGAVYLMEFVGSEDLALGMHDHSCEMLFNDPEVLTSLAEAYETVTMDGYLAIDKYSGLPTAAGFLYEGEHTIEQSPYLLSYQLDQSFVLGSSDTYEAVHEAAPPVPEGTPDATPLFYKVTGDQGQTMWLLGTIHAGDARTSKLPEKIYEALDSSDALAVEFDIQAFAELAETDPQLQATVTESYFYDDGSTLSEHIDPQLYDMTVKLLKASGEYSQNVLHMKPFAAESLISNFFIRQGHLLTYNHGVDNRLLDRAKDAGIEILNVESEESQRQMLTGFSDALQEWMLEGTVEIGITDYWASTQAMYELWCEGEEEALLEFLQAESEYDEALTEEELALLEEYNNAIGTERDIQMVATAKEYLQSGKTVFFAVGLAHILGEEGLVNGLRDAGYTVEAVQYP